MTATVLNPAEKPHEANVNSKRKQQRWSLHRRMEGFALLLLVPSAVMITLFIAYPIVYSLLLTFSKFTVQEVKWFEAGLTNYEAVFVDRAFSNSVRFTFLYTAIYVPVSMGLALLVAVLLQQVKHGSTLFRSLLFLPTVVPVTMGYLMFQWILEPDNGILNYLLKYVFHQPDLALNWLNDRSTVLGSMVAITLWGFGPWILLLAGILAIPKDYYEAAKVDGANPVQEFFYITLPMLRNTLMVVTTIQLIKALKIFVPIYVLTGGGPVNKSESLYFLVFLRLSGNKLEYATTVGWVFTIIVTVLSIITALAFRTRKNAA